MSDDNPYAYPSRFPSREMLEFPDRFEHGMTLRDYFAGQTLCSIPHLALYKPASIAKWCYEVADAMLEERKK